MTTAAPAMQPLREATVSATINSVLSALFFLALFHSDDPARIWALQGLAFDFVPQSFMVALMGAMVPALIAANRMARLGLPVMPRLNIIRGPLLLAIAGVILSAGSIFVILKAADVDSMPFAQALIMKVAFAIASSFIVTPVMMRRLSR